MKDLVSRLERETDKLIETLDAHPVASALFAGTITAAHYAAYLEQTAHYVASARELLRASAERLLTTCRYPVLARLLLEKAEEEGGHDAWAQADRAALGFDSRKDGPNVAVQAYVAGHRFEAETGSGAAFLGTAYILEGIAARRAPSTVRNLLIRSPIRGIERAVSFLRSHGEEDQGHIAHLAELLRGFHDVEDSQAILRSARWTRRFFPGFFPQKR